MKARNGNPSLAGLIDDRFLEPEPVHEVCCICGFDITKEQAKPLTQRDRQWAGSTLVRGKWICGNCNDEIGRRWYESRG